jgi:adenosylcobinamide kinase / adenosylcobinamide-phosphate guanylyltransferase
MGRLELVTGGARSGKSAFAEVRAEELARERGTLDVTYVATALPIDEEMVARIAHHRTRRPATWRTVEAPVELAQAVIPALGSPGVVLVDCLAVWASNRLFAAGDPESADAPAPAAWWAGVDRLEDDLLAELETVVAGAAAAPADLLLVTNEVGLGLVPPSPVGRAYRDLLGRLNQRAAVRADAVHLLVAGIPVDLRRLSSPAPGEDHVR